MKTIVLKICFILAFIPITAAGQAQELLEAVNEQTVELTETQEKLLEVIRSRPQTQEVRLVTIPGTENLALVPVAPLRNP